MQNGIKLTKIGNKIFSSLEEMFKLFDSKNLEMKDSIVIGTTKNIADYFLEDVIVCFYKDNPKIKLSIKTTDSNTLKKLLINREIDIIIDYLPCDIDNSDVNIKVTPLGEYKTCFACTNEYYKDNKDKLIRLNDIVKHNIIAPGTSRRRQILDQFLSQNNEKISPDIEVHNSKLLLDLVRLNKGIGYFIYDEISDKLDEFSIIGNLDDYPKNSIGAVYFNKYISKNLLKFINCVERKSNIEMGKKENFYELY